MCMLSTHCHSCGGWIMHNTDVNRATSMRMYFSNYSSKIPYHALLLYSMCTMTLIHLHVNMGGCGTVWAAALMFMDMICSLAKKAHYTGRTHCWFSNLFRLRAGIFLFVISFCFLIDSASSLGLCTPHRNGCVCGMEDVVLHKSLLVFLSRSLWLQAGITSLHTPLRFYARLFS